MAARATVACAMGPLQAGFYVFFLQELPRVVGAGYVAFGGYAANLM